MLKFAKPDCRKQLLIDTGFRCHLTTFARTKLANPSIFVAKLRKYLRTRRVTSVSQIGTDRTIEIRFGEGQYRLFLEFYAGGNIVLTDKDLVILSLFRKVTEGVSQEELRVGLPYSLGDRQNYNGIPPLTEERVREGLQGFLDRATEDASPNVKKVKKKSGDTLRRALVTTLNEFPPLLIDHAFKTIAFDPSTKVEEVLADGAQLDRLMLVLCEAQTVIDDITKSESPKGYIIAKPLATKSLEPGTTSNPKNGSEVEGSKSLIYEDFHPFRPRQFAEDPGISILEFNSFNETVDEFFSSSEAQKLESRLLERENNARDKLMAVRQDHEKRLTGLQQVQEMHFRKAQAIETNLERVQEVMAVVNGLIAQGMDWVEIARLVEMEQARHNPIADMIELPLKLYENTVTLLLPEASFDDVEDFNGDETGSDVSDSDKEKDKENGLSEVSRIAVDIDLALSPWSNAREYYEQKKSVALKEQKTQLSSAKAMKNSEKKVNIELKKVLKQEKEVLRPLRNPLWFEKFLFFISSENYLVLAGNDAQQNEILYKRYLRKGDIFVHADLEGAIPVIIKNTHENPDDPIPPSTLSQAGTLSVATSIAWDSKALMAAWWVKAEQVSKFTSTGDLLNQGEFSVQDPKTFLPPAQLLLGFGVFFHISDESKARHLKHRVPGDVAPTHEMVDKVRYNDLDGQIRVEDEDYLNDSDKQEIFFSEHETKHPAMDEQNEEPEELKGSPSRLIAAHLTNRQMETGANRFGSKDVATMQSDLVFGSSNEDLSESGREKNPTKENESQFDLQSLDIHDDYPSDQGINEDPAAKTPKSIAFSTPKASVKNDAKKEAQFVRGKKGKNRKIKNKYADQDDEDRALALQLLGSSIARGKSEDEVLATKHIQNQDIVMQRQRQKEQHALTVARGREAEEIRKTTFEKRDDFILKTSEECVDLETFVGTPQAGDQLLDVLVMCGPWDAIGARCRWKAKLQPGLTKKGKAVKDILASWNAVIEDQNKRRPKPDSGEHPAPEEENTTKRIEEELLKGIQAPSVVGLVPVSKCRVIMGGGNTHGSNPGRSGAAGKGNRGGRGSKGGRSSKEQK